MTEARDTGSLGSTLTEDQENPFFIRFVKLTNEALLEKDMERFINLLLERSEVFEEMAGTDALLSEEKVMQCLALENRILERIGKEKSAIRVLLEQVIKSLKAKKGYAKYPLPSVPVFVNERG
jgi:hypothetical protein